MQAYPTLVNTYKDMAVMLAYNILRVHDISAAPFFYQPLVGSKLIKAFVVIFAVLVALILLLCLLIASPALPSTGWTHIRSFME